MSDGRSRLRSLLGASSALWAGADGVRVEPGWWLALSGSRGVDFNVALCHGPDGRAEIREAIDAINARRVPGLVMVASQALGEVDELVDAGWTCVGAVPFMCRELRGADALAPTGARRLDARASPAARAIVDDVFDIGPELAGVALPDAALTAPGQSIWGLHDDSGTLVSCVGAVVVEDAIVVWSMATARAHRRRGYGARLLAGVLADAARSGISLALLQSSPDGEALYRSLGYVELERWQMWSRPRWVLGRR